MRRLDLAAALGLSLALAACEGAAGPPVQAHSDPIINGTTITRGSLASLGVVKLSNGCTGTLVSNQHVLTARHCVRTWNTTQQAYTTANLPGFVTLEGATVADDQSIAVNQAFEPVTTTLNQGDYAILELATAAKIDGSSDHFFNSVYGGADNLVGQTVTCAGYGYNTYAQNNQTAMGLGVLRTAEMTVQSIADGAVTYAPNASGQIGAGGDSGSTCFLHSPSTGAPVHIVTSVQSTCNGSGVDLNGDNIVSNNEWTSISACHGAAPATYSDFWRNQVLADVTIRHTWAPDPGGAVSVDVAGPGGTTGVFATAGAEGSQVAEKLGVRSGFLEVSVIEPAQMFCSRASTTTPLGGGVTVDVSCLSDGLAPLLFAM